MPLTAVDTLSAATDFANFFDGYVPEITELSVVRVDGTTWVYGHTSNGNDGFITLRMNNAGGLTYVNNTGAVGPSIYKSFDEDNPSGFTPFTLDGTTYLTGSNFFEVGGVAVDHGLFFYEVQSDGSLVSVASAARDANTEQVSATIFVPNAFGDQVFTFEVATTGGTAFRDLIVSNFADFEDIFSDVRAFAPNGFANADVFATGFSGLFDVPSLFFTRSDNHNIAWVTVDEFFSTEQIQLLGTGSNGAAGAATDMEFLEIGDEEYLFTTNPTYGVKLFDIGRVINGVLLDSQGGSDNVAKWEASEIAAFQIDGRQFVATGGEKIGIFEVSEDGDLFLAESFGWSGGPALDLEAHKQGGKILLVASGAEGVSTFEFEPGATQDQTGTAGNDRLIGDVRDNVLIGRGGRDTLTGFDGEDSLTGNGGNDRLIGGKGDDGLYGDNGNDRLDGGNGDDGLFGGKDRDALNGGDGLDRLYGGAGVDVLKGGKNGDRLYGGDGKDVLIGGGGKDIMGGGAGADRFVFGTDGSVDRITDFSGNDVIDMRAFGNGVRFRDLDLSVSSTNVLYILRIEYDDAAITIADRDRLRVSDLDRDDFLFG